MHFLANLREVTDEVESLHSISYTSHCAVWYHARTKRVAYCIHSLTALKKVLEEQKAVKLNPKVAFRHFEQVDGMECDSSSRLLMKDKIARARANATNLAYLERIKQTLTSRIALVISEGERPKLFTGPTCTRQQTILSFNYAFLFKNQNYCDLLIITVNY